MPKDEFTIDSIYRPDIRIKQSRRGYRFAIDAVLLAHFLKLDANQRALEVGCGNGVVLVLLATLQKYSDLTGVEIQPEMAALARENLALNSIRDATIVEGDINELAQTLPPHSFDLVYSNPPYRKEGEGKLNPQEEKAIARHEIRMKLEDLFASAQLLLRPTGKLTMILPAFRESDFFKHLSGFRMPLRELQYVHSFASEPPAFVLATVSPTVGMRLDYDPLFIYESPGVYTAEMQRLLSA